MPRRIPEAPEVRWIREALRTAVTRNPRSHSELEQELGLAAGTLDAIFTGKRELGVRHLFGIPRVMGMSLWQVLLQELPVGESGPAGEDHAR